MNLEKKCLLSAFSLLLIITSQQVAAKNDETRNAAYQAAINYYSVSKLCKSVYPNVAPAQVYQNMSLDLMEVMEVPLSSAEEMADYYHDEYFNKIDKLIEIPKAALADTSHEKWQKCNNAALEARQAFKRSLRKFKAKFEK